MAAKGLQIFEELRRKLAGLEKIGAAAGREGDRSFAESPSEG
jgi:hypothetical protein